MLLRRRLLRAATAGAAYVPFIGDGDLAVELYADRAIYGADLDAARVATARSRLPSATIEVADCDGWPFDGLEEPIAVADFDSYAYPYDGLRAFWSAARPAQTVVLFGTDGQMVYFPRSGNYRRPSGESATVPDLNARRRVFNFYFPRHVVPYLIDLAARHGYEVIRKAFYRRSAMLYWGVVVRRG